MMEGRRRELTFGVFAGGIGGSLVTAFTVEFGKAQISFAAHVSLRLNLISNKQVHESGMSEQELFHRLNEADVYVILGHIHQGNPQWSAVVIQELLTELKATRKVGWPERKHLTCPVFTQDKYQYIHKCHMVTIPTLRLDFGEDLTDEIFAFMSVHDEGHGWILKLPFITNSEGLKFCRSHIEVLQEARRHATTFGHRMAYSLLQPCLANRKEYKVVLFDGVASYVADINQRKTLGKSFSTSPHSELKCFAEKVCEVFESRCDDALIQPILRVDVMESKNGLVVNELESLEACFYSKHFDRYELPATDYIHAFWSRTINVLVTEFLSTP